jgi:hypothetical protein
MLSARARSREAAAWQTMAAKERVCEALDLLVRAGDGAPDARRNRRRHKRMDRVAGVAEDRSKSAARRDGAPNALSDPGAAGDYLERVETASSAARVCLNSNCCWVWRVRPNFSRKGSRCR